MKIYSVICYHGYIIFNFLKAQKLNFFLKPFSCSLIIVMIKTSLSFNYFQSVSGCAVKIGLY